MKYIAIIAIPTGHRADTDTSHFITRTIGQFASRQAAEQAAQAYLNRLALPDTLPTSPCYHIKPTGHLKPRFIPTAANRAHAAQKLADIRNELQLQKG